MKVKVATKSRFGRKNSVDFDFEKFQDGFEDSNTRSMVDTGVSTSTSLQSYGGVAYDVSLSHFLNIIFDLFYFKGKQIILLLSHRDNNNRL